MRENVIKDSFLTRDVVGTPAFPALSRLQQGSHSMGCPVRFGSLDYTETLSQESRVPER